MKLLIGSSQLIEFFIAFAVGLVAVLAALFCIGFLLVEPISDPNGLDTTNPEPFGFDACEAIEEVVPLNLNFPEQCNGTNFTRSFCNESLLCTTSNGVCRDGNRRCCCRAQQEEEIDLVALDLCQSSVVPLESRISATICGCTVCDDIEVTVIVTVLSRMDDSPVATAQIFNDDTDDYLGITIGDGTFQFQEPHGTEVLRLRVQASNFMEARMSVPISVQEPVRLVRILLDPITIIPVGLGASALTLRLGTGAALSAPPRAFTTSSGQVYEDLISFNGMFSEPTDGELPGLPEGADQFIISGDQFFGITLLMFLDFVDTDMNGLSATDLTLAVSVEGGFDSDQLVLFVFNETSGEWEFVTPFNVQTDSRRKRQANVEIFVAEGVPVGSFAAVAANLNISCWLQARTFFNISEPRTNVIVVLDQRSTIMGRQFLYRFGTNTGSQTIDGLQDHALCIPLACDDFTSATLEAQVAGVQLDPVDFDISIFDMMENPPISFGHVFFFTELTTFQDAGEPRPFYNSEDSCVQNGGEIQDSAGNEPADYFAFTTSSVTPPDLGEFCYIKVQVRDCFNGSSVTVISINPATSLETFRFTATPTEGDMSMPIEFSGEFNDTGACTAETSNTLAACIPFNCTDGLQVRAQQSPDSGLTGSCDVLGLSVVLTDNPVLVPRVTEDIVQIDTTILVPDNYNNPDLGLYHDPTSSSVARQRCFAGDINAATQIDTTVGYAATFQCGFQT